MVERARYAESLASTMGSREYANSRLRSVVENVFKHPESMSQGCALSSAAVVELMAMQDQEAWETLNRLVNYPEGTILTATIEEGTKPENRYLFFATKPLRAALGNKESFFTIKVESRIIIRRYSPTRQRYQYLVPSWVGEPGQKIEVEVKNISNWEILETARQTLPFELIFTEDGWLMRFHSIEFLVSVEKFGWDEHHNAPVLNLRFNTMDLGDGRIKEHTVRIVCRGYETYLVLQFGDTKGTINYMKSGSLPGEIVINYVDSKSKSFNHRIIPESIWKSEYKLPTEIGPLEKEWTLSDEEYEEIEEGNEGAYGNSARNRVMKKVLKAGQIFGRKVKDFRLEAQIADRGVSVDLVLITEDDKLIVIEVKSTIRDDKIWEQYLAAIKSLKVDPGYMKLIREYGLDVKGVGIRKDVDLYVACAVYLDKINKVGRIVEFEAIPED